VHASVESQFVQDLTVFVFGVLTKSLLAFISKQTRTLSLNKHAVSETVLLDAISNVLLLV